MDCGSPFYPISKYAIDPALRRIKCLRNAKKNVDEMIGELDILIAMSKDVQQELLEVERRHAMRRTNFAAEWLSKVSDAEATAERIKSTYSQRGCLVCGDCSFRFCAIYYISKNAENHLEALKDLVGKKPSNETLVAPASPEKICEILTSTNVTGLTPYLMKIKNYLEDDKVGIIGIWGMGGVGKSTLLDKINNDLHSLHNNRQNMLHDHVIKVVASKEFSVAKLQKDIAKRMKLDLPKDADPQENAGIIFNYLKDKNFLVLLDDLWKAIDLKDLGIPNPLDKVAINAHKRKVIITTRSEEVCGRMRAKALKIECLDFEHAWPLFKDIVGEETFLSNPIIEDLAKQVARECRGLPLALNVIGGGMAMKTDVEVWNHCLNSLRNSQANNDIFDLEESLFNVLKFSYDQLRNDTLRECFLSCSLWPEDENIHKEELITCWLGLGLMDDVVDIEQAYGRGHSFITILQQSCLLEPGIDDHVKMHDVMRDLALWIANGCGKSNYKWIVRNGVTRNKVLKEIEKWSLAKRVSIMYSKIDELPLGPPSCPNLSVLMLNGNKIERIPKEFFQCLTSLTYLDLSWNQRMANLPSSIGLLSQLKYLDLSYTSIKSLPKEMEKLEKLEYLFLYETKAVVSQELVPLLQTLKVLNTYPGTTIIDPTLVRCLSRGKLIALGIAVETMETFQEVIKLNVSITHLAIKNLENVHSFPLPPEQRYLRHLRLASSSSLEEIVIGGKAKGIEFPKLRRIELESLTRLERIDWNGLEPASCFRILEFVKINGCKFKNVSWVLELPKLQVLQLSGCDEMERVIGEEEEKEFLERKGTSADTAAFPSLDFLILRGLPLLESICGHPLLFPYLGYAHILDCPKLKRLPFRPEMATNNKGLEIRAEQSWWDGLEWNDKNTKASISNIFTAY